MMLWCIVYMDKGCITVKTIKKPTIPLLGSRVLGTRPLPLAEYSVLGQVKKQGSLQP